jgi:hypothetical protein
MASKDTRQDIASQPSTAMEAQAICETSDFSMLYRAAPATNPASWFPAARERRQIVCVCRWS